MTRATAHSSIIEVPRCAFRRERTLRFGSGSTGAVRRYVRNWGSMLANSAPETRGSSAENTAAASGIMNRSGASTTMAQAKPPAT